jgi:hypothetical protein
MRGFDVALAIVSEPVEFGLIRMIDSLSWLAIVQPAGNGTVAPKFVTEVAPFVDDVGEAIGLGDVPGVGLGRPEMPPPAVNPPPPRSAIAVPQPAITTTRTTIALMMSTHGVRCTAACGAAAAGA